MSVIATCSTAPTAAVRADCMAQTAPTRDQSPPEPEKGSLRRAVLLTVAYSDVFNYPLRADEVWRNLVIPAPQEAVTVALDNLVPDALSRTEDGLYCLRGREQIGPIRQARAASAPAGWKQAQRFTRWLAHVPFIRMVAVCGSLAVENAGPDGDVDLFLITAPRRLWLVQSAAMILRRLAWRPGRPPFCPNYLLSESELAVGPRNLYIAHEITQARPLLGQALFGRFRQANAWTVAFLPQNRPDDAPDPVPGPDPLRGASPGARPVSRIQRALERCLAGRLGSWLDAAIHRTLLLYYRFRLRRHGWTLDEIGKAYRRDRQTVVTGGYLGAIETRFVACAQSRLSAAADMPEHEAFELVRKTFHGDDRPTPDDAAPDDAPSGPPGGDPVYAGILGERYGDDAS